MDDDEKETGSALDRMTDGGMCIIGDEVIHDGEAEKHGVKPKTRVRKRSTWPDTDD